MRCVSFVVFACLMLDPLPSAAAPPRPVDAWAEAVLVLARQRSAVVRALLHELDQSNVIVHVESSRELPNGIGGITRLVTSRGGYRYVRISLSVWLPPADRIAILGHELHHAVEVARSAAIDGRSLRRLFAAEGYVSRGDDYYETRAALRVERQIRGELRRPELRTSRQASLPDK